MRRLNGHENEHPSPVTRPRCFSLVPVAARKQRHDRFAELLECMADLLVETRRQCEEITQHPGSDDPRVREAGVRLAELERSLGDVGVEVAAVHQLLQHVHLI